jgi:hypothetical protein
MFTFSDSVACDGDDGELGLYLVDVVLGRPKFQYSDLFILLQASWWLDTCTHAMCACAPWLPGCHGRTLDLFDPGSSGSAKLFDGYLHFLNIFLIATWQ